LQPLTIPRLWRPRKEEAAHVAARARELSPRTTALDVLEETLQRFDAGTVRGASAWFRELGGARGYWFDKRIHALTFEMFVAVAMEWAQVTKLPRPSAGKGPDLLAQMPGLMIVAEVKLLLGKYWPLKIVQTMLTVLRQCLGVPEAGDVFVWASRSEVHPDALEREVGALGVGELLDAIAAVGAAGTDVSLTANLSIGIRTSWERLMGVQALVARLPTGQHEWNALFDSMSTSFEGIRKACEEAWDQCSAYVAELPSSAQRLDVAALSCEYRLGHPDLAPTLDEVRIWLETEVWPYREAPSVVLAFQEMLAPVWLVNPHLRVPHR